MTLMALISSHMPEHCCGEYYVENAALLRHKKSQEMLNPMTKMLISYIREFNQKTLSPGFICNG